MPPSPWEFTDFPDGSSVQDPLYAGDGSDPQGVWVTHRTSETTVAVGILMLLSLYLLVLVRAPWNVLSFLFAVVTLAGWAAARRRRPDKYPSSVGRSTLYLRQPAGPRLTIEEQVDRAFAQTPLKGVRKARVGSTTTWQVGASVAVQLFALPRHGPGTHPDGLMPNRISLVTIGRRQISVHRHVKGLVLGAVEGVAWGELPKFEPMKTARVVEGEAR